VNAAPLAAPLAAGTLGSGMRFTDLKISSDDAHFVALQNVLRQGDATKCTLALILDTLLKTVPPRDDLTFNYTEEPDSDVWISDSKPWKNLLLEVGKNWASLLSSWARTTVLKPCFKKDRVAYLCTEDLSFTPIDLAISLLKHAEPLLNWYTLHEGKKQKGSRKSAARMMAVYKLLVLPPQLELSEALQLQHVLQPLPQQVKEGGQSRFATTAVTVIAHRSYIRW
jgi:hypothetical protein